MQGHVKITGMIDLGLSRRRMLLYCSQAMMWNALAASRPASQHHDHEAGAPTPEALQFFTPEEAADIESICAQIIPSDDMPGAREAGVIHFIDRALASFDREKQSIYHGGLEKLRIYISAASPGARRMEDLSNDQQIKLLSEIEHSEFFETLRIHTVMGFFGNPTYGGNQDQAGWKLIGFEDKFVFQPPFGHYDSEK
jgi:gluconate 2-dehydrogenase gamma chain